MTGARGRAFFRHTLALARVEVIHVTRDRATLVQMLIVPVIQLMILSNVATFAIRQSPTYVVDFDHTSTSRGLVSRLKASGWFDIVGQSSSPALADDAMLRGDVTMAVTIPHDFEASLVRTGVAPLHLDVNAEKGAAAGVVQSYAAEVIDDYATELGASIHPSVRAALEPSRPSSELPPIRAAGRIEMQLRDWFDPDLDYKRFMVPGILVALVTMVGTLLTAQNIAREKEMGTLEQINVTPITKAEFITAKLAPFWVLGMVDLFAGLTVAHVLFGVPVQGSLFLLFVAAAIYLVGALGLGLWISSTVETQQQAMFVSFFILLVYLLMSGLFTPVDSMPRWVQIVSEFNPVRHFATIMRAILIKGASVAELAEPLLALVALGAVILATAILQYRKRSA